MRLEFRHWKMPVDMTQLPSHVDSKAAHTRLGEAYGFSPSAWITLRVIHRSTGTATIFRDEGISYFRQKTV
jgi:hypothetical protein